VASRVDGVRLVQRVRLVATGGSERTTLELQGLQLPRVAGIAVQLGDAADPALLAGGATTSTTDVLAGGATTSTTDQQAPIATPRTVPVPVVPQDC
jgi:hypothetical protein